MSCCQIMELTAWLKIAQCTGDLFSPLRGWLYRVWPLLSFFSSRGKVIGGSVIILSVGILTAEGEIYSFFIYSYISFIIYDWQKKKKKTVTIASLLYRNRAIVDVLGESLTMAIRIFIFTLLAISALLFVNLFFFFWFQNDEKRVDLLNKINKKVWSYIHCYAFKRGSIRHYHFST